ncbi:MAG TPA: DEAD/DEAH box helicase [Vicinamibacterales bacterium]|nr:DEAD/DEAH box helicase [Vicinamibacterales bacterium]
MSFAQFHPLVQRWFTEAIGEPTAAQLRGWEAIHAGRHSLIAAPTGSGKTLAAFLSALDGLTQEGLASPLPDEVRVLYVSPLKALSADIHRNLAEPRRALRKLAEASGLAAPSITAAVRTGDTTQAERAAIIRTPPHILVTTPESLYLLLTADRSRHLLRTVRTVIVDEIHAVIGTRRGAHLALSLERLQDVAIAPLQRIGLSATQKPIDLVARYLTGAGPAGSSDAAIPPDCALVDEGHRRRMDLGVEIPRSPLDAVMSREVWEEYYDRLADLVRAHRTTLVFVNTRRLAERVCRHLEERLGEGTVTAHHGSLSKEKRLDAETRLKSGRLRALVATASLELGIDIGHVDLVCQLGSPHRIATLLQRVGRSGHTIDGLPKGRVFPASRDDLVECAAMLRAIRGGELDRVLEYDAPLDVLAQQIVAEASTADEAALPVDRLFALVRRAWPYRELSRADFDAVVRMAAEGYSTRRGRRAALLHHDEVNGTIRGRRGSRLLALTSGGAIPEVADYRVVLEPGDTFIGTLNEDFAIESMAGDVFQLGNASWRVLQVSTGTVRVADAAGVPPNIPFWFGEAPARSDELSRAVSDLRADVERRLVDGPPADGRAPAVAAWLCSETGLEAAAAEQIVEYLDDGRRLLGCVPTQQTLVLERFFDESGGMQLVLHAPFGSRINKAWGLALRKRFCRQFNFELQAAATEDALLLSLGPQHSFPLADVFRYLHPNTTRDVLVQAFLDAPMFQTRWRWNATISLAVPRSRGGRKVAPQIQRMLAEDLLASAFPDAAACLENIPGDREIPDHPLVQQTVRDCLSEAMDLDGLLGVLRRIHDGTIALVARDTPEPSVFTHEILNARPYAFLDDAPLEERRAHAVQTRRAGEPSSVGDLGALDPAAIERVRDEVRPDPRDPDELHDALVVAGFLLDAEVADPSLMDALVEARRAAHVLPFIHPAAAEPGTPHGLWIAAERVPELRAVHPSATLDPPVAAPPSRARAWTRDEAVIELVRGRLTILGPTTAAAVAGTLGLGVAEAEPALVALESEGVVLRGAFTPRAGAPASLEWCDRTLLARIHRYTLGRLRAEIEPVSPADFMRFLFTWQHVSPDSRLTGVEGLREAVALLDGFELGASAWERSVLPARLDRYDPAMLDMLCLAGEVGWTRFSRVAASGEPAQLGPSTPVALFLREHAGAWRTLGPQAVGNQGSDGAGAESGAESRLPEDARMLLGVLRDRGACFFADLQSACGFDAGRTRQAIGALVAAGLAASDGFSGLRALVSAAAGRPGAADRRAKFAGRWTALQSDVDDDPESAVLTQAWVLLRRYGVVFRRVLARETLAVPWRELVRVYRRLEARGEVRGGRFVSGMSGEQFALPDAIPMLRETRRRPADGRLVAIAAPDPLNLTGLVTAGERIRAAGRTRIAYRDGVPVAVREGDYVRHLAPLDPAAAAEVARALDRRTIHTLRRAPASAV